MTQWYTYRGVVYRNSMLCPIFPLYFQENSLVTCSLALWDCDGWEYCPSLWGVRLWHRASPTLEWPVKQAHLENLLEKPRVHSRLSDVTYQLWKGALPGWECSGTFQITSWAFSLRVRLLCSRGAVVIPPLVDGKEPAPLEPTLCFLVCQFPVCIILLVDLYEVHW